MAYDSRPDTWEHISEVRRQLDVVLRNLMTRADQHDKTKLVEPEVSVFDAVTARLKTLTYGSPEYKASLAEMGEGLKHHYAHNSHHPEHYENGIEGMSLLDLIEMLCDWKAATLRHADGDLNRSLSLNADRFQIAPGLQSVLANTIKELGF